MATTETKTHEWAFIRIYANLIKNGRRTIEQVPTRWRQDVQDYMDGKISPDD